VAAVARADGAEAGWVLLTQVPEHDVVRYQPYWALRAHLLVELGRREEGRLAYERAAALSKDLAVRSFLLGRGARASQTR